MLIFINELSKFKFSFKKYNWLALTVNNNYEVWTPGLISIDFNEFTSPFTPYLLFRLRRCIEQSRQCVIGYPGKNTALDVVVSPLFSVFGYPHETLPSMFDIVLVNFVMCKKKLKSGSFIGLCSFRVFIGLVIMVCEQPVVQINHSLRVVNHYLPRPGFFFRGVCTATRKLDRALF